MARGFIYEISTDKDTIGCMTENDFYEQRGINAAYFENTKDDGIVEQFLEELQTAGFKVDFDKKRFYRTMDAVKNYFKERYEKFMEEAETLTLYDFTDSDVAARLSSLIKDNYSDAVMCDGTFYDLDSFIRDMGGETYYVGNVVLMH